MVIDVLSRWLSQVTSELPVPAPPVAPRDPSPLELVAELGLFVHGKSERVELFKSVRAVKNPKFTILPTKDVPTRWDSKELAISRVLQLKSTILLYCSRARGCPEFTEETFEMLELIQPALRIFADLTKTYSTKSANSHRVLPDLYHAISELERMGSDGRLTEERSASFKVAAAKVKKFMLRFLVERRSANSVSTTVAVIVLEDSYLLHGMNSSYFGSDQQSSLLSTLALLSNEAFLELAY
jgi:hypothetical protein